MDAGFITAKESQNMETFPRNFGIRSNVSHCSLSFFPVHSFLDFSLQFGIHSF